MKKFLFKVIAFCLCLATLAALFLFVVLPMFPLDLRAFEKWSAKVARLKARPEGVPMFVLVGGSNLYYGIEDEMLYAGLSNRCHVVNMGFHAGLGLGRMLEVVKPYVKAGDIVCIAAEYAHFVGDAYSGGAVAIIHAIDFKHRPGDLFFSRRYAGIPRKGWSNYFKSKVETILGHRTNGGAGVADLHDVPPVPSAKFANRRIDAGSRWQPNETAFAYLKRFADEMKARGVRVVFSAPAFDARLFAFHRDEIAVIGERLEKTGFVRISNAEDFAFPLEFLYDTEYHLNARGRTNRTARLLRDLGRGFGD